SSSSGSVSVSGTSTSLLSSIVSLGAAGVSVSGSLNKNLNPLTLIAAGSVTDAIFGTLGVTLGNAQGVGSASTADQSLIKNSVPSKTISLKLNELPQRVFKHNAVQTNPIKTGSFSTIKPGKVVKTQSIKVKAK